MTGEATVYYNVRNLRSRRWTAHTFPATAPRPVLRRGYELTGPHRNLVAALIAANLPPRPRSATLSEGAGA